jgi:hypothetical protein
MHGFNFMKKFSVFATLATVHPPRRAGGSSLKTRSSKSSLYEKVLEMQT